MSQSNFRLQGDVKLFLDLNFNKIRWLSNSRLVTSLNPILYVSKNRSFFVSTSPSLALQTGRGIGMSMADDKFGSKFRGHFVFSLIAGGQWGDNDYIHKIQNSSQYLSIGFDSDYRNTVSIASNLIYQLGGKKLQFAGNAYIGLSSFEFTYMNDGPPFPKPISDGKDRWWTGSGFLGFTTRQTWQENQPYKKNLSFRLSYDRYTGYTKNAFELADALKMDYSLYGSNGEHLYNRGSMRLGVFTDYGSFEVNANDTDGLDVQYWLHKTRGQALHRTINKSSYSTQFSFDPFKFPYK